MARVPDLIGYCSEHGLKMITVADIVAHRHRSEPLVERIAVASLPTAFGEFVAYGYRSMIDGQQHVAMVMGDVDGAKDVLVRVHSECLTGDVFHSLRCDCGEQLDRALAQIASEGAGVLLYLSQEGRGIGLLNKLRAYELQEQGLDTVDANLALGLPVDSRDYGLGYQILSDLGLTTLRVMTNNPKKLIGLEGYGLEVTEQVPIVAEPNPVNERYLRTKAERMGHTISHQSLRVDTDERGGAGEDRDPRRLLGGHRPAGCQRRVAIVVSRYNAGVVERLLEGAVTRLAERGIARDRLTIALVPGAWELPLACSRWPRQVATRRSSRLGV